MNRERELLIVALDFLDPRRWLDPADQHVLNILTRDIEELLAQPENIPDVGNMVTQEPVYWENEKKALLNEIDHLTNRLAQPEQEPVALSEEEIKEATKNMSEFGADMFKAGIMAAEKARGIGE